ncbi:hypothetical protein M9458_016343, partial [Cirrhinus mrigala]
PDIVTEAEIHRLTFGKRSWNQSASPTEQDPVGCDQHEAPPVKKFDFGQLITALSTKGCHPASGEEEKRIDIVDSVGQPFWSCRSALTGKDSSDSVFKGISKEPRTEPDVFIQVQHSNHMSNVEKPTLKLEDLESSHCWQNSTNSELSIPVESCVHDEIRGSISVLECVQDTRVRSSEILDSEKEKDNSGSERREITK